ncbi:hypothetical protein Bpfe_003478 [Biomphalaria pfeifferi]|uniref:Uncharacterized protein n=1 Tax=Biomphalaria pfeifferi TaxID=112525 RepID=A0AAD8C6V3_BIOPF|nr:hypothetical protein Bpfe_003478 [Biomphalaria pfeifferi]
MDRFLQSMLIVIIVIFCILMYTGNCYADKIREGESYTIFTKFKHVLKEDLEVVWFDNDETVSQCSLRGGCMEDFEDETRSALEFNPETGLASCNMTILKLTRKCIGTWRLRYLGTAGLVHPESLFICTITALSSNVLFSSCDSNLQEDAIHNSDSHNMQETVLNRNPNLILFVTVPLVLVAVMALVTCFCVSYVKIGKYGGIEKCKMYWIFVARESHGNKESSICIEKPTVFESLIIQKV